MGLDPVTAVANAVTAALNLGTEYLKFLQTPAGQKIAEADAAAIMAVAKGVSDTANAGVTALARLTAK